MSEPSLQPLEQHLLEALQAHHAMTDLVIAFSGGIDSKVLLHASVQLASKGLIGEVSAVHVDHGLQAESAQWSSACQADCKRYAVKLEMTRLELDRQAKINRQNHTNTEALAREKRYQFFESIITEKSCLLMAHHQDDQAETLLFRLLRGCGLDGAAAMPLQRPLGKGRLLRPLLTISRSQIEDYAQQNQLTWLEDPSNRSAAYSRNFLRHQVLTKIKQKWPAYAKTFSRFTLLADAQRQLAREIAEEDLESTLGSNTVFSSLSKAGESPLKIEKLQNLSLLRQKNLLHHWGLVQRTLAPSHSEIVEVIRQLPAAETSSIEISFAGGTIKSYQGQIYLINRTAPEPLTKKYSWLDLRKPLLLDNGLTLSATTDSSGVLRAPNKNEPVSISARNGGEKCCPQYRQHSTSLKKIYQELGVPPWLREWLPLIYYGEEIAAVPGVFVVRKFAATEQQPSLALSLG